MCSSTFNQWICADEDSWDGDPSTLTTCAHRSCWAGALDDREVSDVEWEGEKASPEKDMPLTENSVQTRCRRGAAENKER